MVRNNEFGRVGAARKIGAAVATLGAVLVLGGAPLAVGQEKFIVVASTTSTQDSGLFGHILPIFKAKTGIDVRVVAQGTGQALATAKKGDADVVFVHDKVAEAKFV
ncbi:MAG: substrate-binding domain-containing protein, partial [Usitatibacteraceae bacterium]